MAIKRTASGSFAPVGTPLPMKFDRFKAQCSNGCTNCCCQGTTDNLNIEYCRVSTSQSDAKRDPNPNTSTDKCCSSTLACIASLALTAGELGLIKLTGGLSIATKAVAGTCTVVNLARTTKKNIPFARDRNGDGVPKRGKLPEEMNCSESTHVPRTVKNVLIAGGACAYGYFTGQWNQAIAGAGGLNCVSQAGETAINCGQERPYVECREGKGFFSCCACSKCCQEEADVSTKAPLVDPSADSPSMTRA